jgi:hypothetical protein
VFTSPLHRNGSSSVVAGETLLPSRFPAVNCSGFQALCHSIKIDIELHDCVEIIHLAQDGTYLWAFVITLMNYWIP